MLPFSCSSSLGQLSPVYIFRDIRATFPSGVKNDLRPCFGLMLFLTRPKFSAISRRGSNFVSCPIRPFRKLNSRAHKKLNSGNAMFGAISGKFRTFDVQINFAIPPIFHFSRWLWGILFPFSKLRNFYHFINQLVRKAKKLFEHFTTVSKYHNSPESCIIPQITPKFERLIHLSPLQSTNNLREILYHVLGVLH